MSMPAELAPPQVSGSVPPAAVTGPGAVILVLAVPPGLICTLRPHTGPGLRILAQSRAVVSSPEQSSDGLGTAQHHHSTSTAGRRMRSHATALSPSIRTTGRTDPMSTLTTARDMAQIGHRAAGRAADLATAVTAMTPPAAEMSDLAELEALAETAETIYQLAECECADAREQLAEAQARIEAANDAWVAAGKAMDAARTRLGHARQMAAAR